MKINKTVAWNFVILMVRIWLGFRMFTASYSSIISIIFHPKERVFFEKWFGEELHFPMPLAMAFLAKGSELAGGVLVFVGLFTRVSASLIAFTMLVATLTANLGQDFNIDGGFTISYFMFALILIVEGGGKYSLDYLILRRSAVSNKNLIKS
jgi:putative oxidoreductase